jgi:small-conductance mechanosensitive channel
MMRKLAIPILLVLVLFIGPSLLLFSGETEAQTSNDQVILLDRYDPDEVEQTFGPGKDATYKWLLYTDEPTTRYLVVITADVSNSKFKVDISSEGDENLIVDQDTIIYIKMTVTTSEEMDDVDTEITVTFKVIPLTQGGQTTYMSRDVRVNMETPKPDPVVEFIGLEWAPPKDLGGEQLEKWYVRFIVEIVLYTVLSIVIFFLISPGIKTLTGKTKTKVDDMLVELLRMPIFLLLVTWGLLQSVKALNLPPSSMGMFNKAWFVFAMIIVTFVAIKMFKTLTRYFGRLYAKKTKVPLDQILVPAVNKIGTVIIVFMCLMFAFDKFGVDITVFLTGMGIAGLVIAFAAQDTLSNFFGGIFLIIEPKFKAGDQVMIGDKYYIVREIGMRTTVLYDSVNNQEVIMPNNKLANENIVNMVQPDVLYRVGVKCFTAYGVEVNRVEKILKQVVKANPKVIIDNKHKIYFEFSNMGESSLEFLIKVWIRDLGDRWSVAHEIRKEIYNRFNEEGIEIPFNQLDLHVRSMVQHLPPKPPKDPLDV